MFAILIVLRGLININKSNMYYVARSRPSAVYC